MYVLNAITEKYVFIYFIAFIVLTVLAVFLGSYDYNRKGYLSKMVSYIVLSCGIAQGGLALSVTACSAYINQNSFLLTTTGVLLNIAGLIIILIALIEFRSFRRALGQNTNKLITTGIYSYTRNPQYVGYALMQIGWFIGWWSHLAVLALISFVVMAFFAVVMEERNLGRIYTKEYEDYCRKVARFIGL